MQVFVEPLAVRLRSSFSRITLVLMLTGVAVYPRIGHAQSTWQGNGTNSTWSTTDNWSTALGNGFNTGLVFQGSSSLANTNDLTSGTATSITFNAGAGAFTIGGNAIALTGSIANNSANVQSIANNITLLANSTVTGTNVTLSGILTNSGGDRRLTNGLGAGRLLTIGAINLSEGNTGRTLQLSGTGNTTISGAIANGGSGAGTFSIGGSLGNAYSGTVTLADNSTYSGTTSLATAALAVIIGGNSAFGTSRVNVANNNNTNALSASTNVVLSNTVSWNTTAAIAGSNSIELAGTAYFGNPTNLSTQLTSSISSAGGKLLTLSGPIYLQASGSSGSGTATLAGTGNTLLSGAIRDSDTGSGTSSLYISNTGTTTISGSNSYSGGTTFGANAKVVIANPAAFGSGTVTANGSNMTFTAASRITLTNPLVIGNNISVGGTNGMTWNAPVTNSGGNRVITNNMTSGTLTFPNTLLLSESGTSRTFTLGGAGNILISGSIVDGGTAAGFFTVTSTGTTTLSGSNSFTGGVTLNGAGTLLIANQHAIRNAPLTISTGGSTLLRTATDAEAHSLVLTNSPNIAGSGNITFINGLTNSGTNRTLANNLDTGKTLTFSGTTFLQESGTGVGRTFTLSGSGNTTFAGPIVNGGTAGNGNLTITNTGVTRLSGSNTYSGTTGVNGGIVVFSGTHAKASGTVTAAAAGTVGLGVGGVNSYTSADVAALFGNTLSGFSMNASSGVAVDTTGGDFTISDVLANNRAFTKLGPNTLTLSGNNSFGGTFTVADGAISVATLNNASANGPLGNSASAVVLGSSGKAGTLSYTGATASSSKPFTAATGGTAAFAVTDSATTLTLSGAIGGSGDVSFGGPGSFVLSGGVSAGSFFKTGAGLLTLSAASTYTGPTTIASGTLKLAAGGSFANSSRIIVGGSGSSGVVLDLTEKSSFSIGAGQTLMGGGSVNLGAGTVFTVSGTFSPGNSPGLFTYSSGTTLLDGTTLMEIWGTSRATSPSHGDGFYDAVNVTSGGVLDFNDSILTLSFDSLFNDGDTFNLFQPSGGASLAGNFGSVNVTGGYYTGLTWTKTGSLWESTPALGGESLSFNAATGTLAVVIVVPEPGTLALVGVGVAVAGWTAMRRRRP